MEDDGPTGAEGAEPPEPVDGIPPLPPELSSSEQEVRRLVEAGAGSPEELRALAARLQEQRSREESLWRQEVRPALIESKKRRPRLADLRGSGLTREVPASGIGPGLAALVLGAVILLLVLATQTTFLWLLLPALGVLVYAWVLGRDTGSEPPPSSPPPSAPD